MIKTEEEKNNNHTNKTYLIYNICHKKICGEKMSCGEISKLMKRIGIISNLSTWFPHFCVEKKLTKIAHLEKKWQIQDMAVAFVLEVGMAIRVIWNLSKFLLLGEKFNQNCACGEKKTNTRYGCGNCINYCGNCLDSD